MTYLLATVIVLGCALAGALCSIVVSRLAPIDTRRRYHEVGAQVFQQVGVMFAVLLAFVFSEVWGEYNTAAQAINGECGALHGASMLANALPPTMGKPVVGAIASYTRSVIDTEWPEMSTQRRSSDRTTEAFRVAFDMAARMPVVAPADVAIRSHIVTLLAEAHANRETRTFQIDRAVPAAMWGVLLSLAVGLEIFVLFAAIESPTHLILAAAFAGFTVVFLVLVRMLDFPFEGALRLLELRFREAAGRAHGDADGAVTKPPESG